MPVEELKDGDLDDDAMSPSHLHEDDLKLEDMLDNGRFK